jgi:HSP20 family protein
MMRVIPYVRKTDVPSGLWPERARFLDGYFNEFPLFGTPAQVPENWTPPVDILEKNGDLVLRAELPGLNEKEIDLKIEGNLLTLRGERKLPDGDNHDNYHRRESFYGTFCRSFTLPETVDRDKIKADYKNGVLTVTIPQKPEVKPREIPVGVQ